MKAKEYISKYTEDLNSNDNNRCDKAGCDILISLSNEAADLIKIRHAQTVPAFVSILKEKNNIWNIIAKNFPNILLEDGFKAYWLNKMPELNFAWK